MDFGLGLILSFTDNASVGMNGAVQSLNNLTSVAENARGSLGNLNSTASLIATSISANTIGNGLLNTGKSMLGLFNRLISKTQQLGSEYEGFGITLNALGMDSEQAINKLFKFANKSPLEVGDVKDMIVTLQSQGINAFDETTGAISKTRQEYLAYLTDLKSFKPEVSNERFKMAIQNYVGSGEKKMMRTAFDMGDIEDIIGHKVSSTAEGRMNDIVEMVEKKGLTGLSENLANSWQGVASNIDDAFTRIFYSVANDGGVFDKLKKSFVDLAKVIIDLPNDKLASLGQTIGDALNTVVTPLTKLMGIAKKVATSLINLSQTRPKLLKWGIVLTTVSGIITVLTGVAFKLIGVLANFTLVMRTIKDTTSSVSKVISFGFSSILNSILPVAIALGLFAFAWKNDLGGIQTNTLNFLNNISKSFSTARTNVDGSVQGLHEALKRLRGENNFWSNITIGLMKMYGAFKFVVEAWNGNTLSEESFEKANELGILPLIESILDLKYRFGLFKKGFIDGWKEIGDRVSSFLSGFSDKVKGTFLETMLNQLTKFLQKLSSGDADSWYQFGKSFADFTEKALIFWATFKVIGSITTKVLVLAKAFSTLKNLIGALSFGGIFNSIGSGFVKLLEKLPSLLGASGLGDALSLTQIQLVTWFEDALVPTIKGMVSSIIGILGGLSAPVIAVIVVALSGIIAYATTHWEEFKSQIVSIWTTLKDEASNIFGSLKDGFVRIWENLKSTIAPVIDSFNNLKSKVVETFNVLKGSEVIQQVISVLSSIGETIMNIVIPAIKASISYASSLIQGVWGVVVSVFNGIISIVGAGLRGLMDTISGLLDIIVGIFTLDFDKILSGVSTIFSSLLNLITTVLGSIFNVIMSVLSLIVNSTSTALKGIFEVVKGIFRGIVSFIGNIMNLVFDKVSSVWNKLSNKVDKITDGMSSSVRTKWTTIKNTITGAIEGARDKVKSAIDKIKSFFNFKWSLPKLKMPHFSITGKFDLKKAKVPKLGVDWYAKGGVFNKPSVIGVGEAGKEAVMPLEKNTGWISELALMLDSRMKQPTPVGNQLTPISNSDNSVTTQTYTRNSVVNNTDNASKVTTKQGNVDNSIHFESGSIVIQAKEFSEKEAEKFAKLIMARIKRQKEIDNMLSYNS